MRKLKSTGDVKLVTIDRLQALLDYDPKTGHFTRKINAGKSKAGSRAGGIIKVKGRPIAWQISVDRVLYSAQQLAWFYVYGRWPPLLSHINRDPLDNRIENIYEATKSDIAKKCTRTIRHASPSGPLTLERLRSILTYDPETGEMTWRTNRAAAARAGENAIRTHIQCDVSVDRRTYRAHRLAWFHHYGTWPKGEVDHIDGDRLNNRIENLREATRSQNAANTRRRRYAPHGKGLRKRGNRYVASFSHGKERFYLGSFATKEEARAAYDEAARRALGEFFNGHTE